MSSKSVKQKCVRCCGWGGAGAALVDDSASHLRKQERLDCYASIQSDCIRVRGFYQVFFIWRRIIDALLISIGGFLLFQQKRAMSSFAVCVTCWADECFEVNQLHMNREHFSILDRHVSNLLPIESMSLEEGILGPKLSCEPRSTSQGSNWLKHARTWDL